MAIFYTLVAWIVASIFASLIRQHVLKQFAPIPIWKDFLFIVFLPIVVIVTVSVKILRWIW